MRFGKLFTVATAFSLVTVPVAAQAATSFGTIRSAQGGVFVARDGAMLPATANMELRAGDRVMTRMGGRAEIASGGCAAPVSSASVYTVGATCGETARNFASLQDSDDAAGTGAYVAEGGGIGGGIVALLAAVAVGLGIYIAIEKSDKNDAPVSA